MSADLAITPATTVQQALSSRPTTSDSSAAQTADTPTIASALSGPPPVNPGLHLDPALNIVVLQFFNAKGDVTQTIPSPKQIQAYQQGAGQPGPGAASHHTSHPAVPT